MKRRAFTLIELLIAITIFALITLAAVANLRGSNPTQALRAQANNVGSLLRQAQIQAQTGTPFNGSLPLGGYGVNLTNCLVTSSNCSVILFADQDSNFTFGGSSELSQTVDLGQDVIVLSVSTGNPTAIVFRPPSGAACFNNLCSGAGVATITLALRNDVTKTALIKVNQVTGQISSN